MKGEAEPGGRPRGFYRIWQRTRLLYKVHLDERWKCRFTLEMPVLQPVTCRDTVLWLPLPSVLEVGAEVGTTELRGSQSQPGVCLLSGLQSRPPQGRARPGGVCSEASTGWQRCTTESQVSPPLDALLPPVSANQGRPQHFPTWLSPGPSLMELLSLRVVTVCVRTPATPRGPASAPLPEFPSSAQAQAPGSPFREKWSSGSIF